MAARKAADLPRAFLVEQRADDVDQPPAGPHQCRGDIEQAPCSAVSRSSAACVSRQRASGLRRQVPVPEQGASTSTASACPARSASASASRPGIEQPRLDDRRARPARRAAPGATAGRDRCRRRSACPRCPSPRRARASCRRPGAQVDHRLARLRAAARGRRAGCRRPAPRSAPSRIGAPSARPACRRAAAGRCGAAAASPRFGQLERVAVGLQRVDPHVERRALEQRGGFRARRCRCGRAAPPARRARCRPRRPARPPRSAAGRGPSRRTAQQIAGSRCASRSIAARPLCGHSPARADRAIDQLAHRAAVLRSGIAARREPVGDDAVGRRRRPARGGDDRVEQLDRRLDARGGGHAPSQRSDNWAPRG